jgi:4a-hydroxytetrahydrobiopterin dehydratase
MCEEWVHRRSLRPGRLINKFTGSWAIDIGATDYQPWWLFREISMKLADKKCSEGGSLPPLKALRARELLKELGHSWRINGKGHLERRYVFKDFSEAQAFANKVGMVAEAEGHHPDLYVAWGKCKLEIWSHEIKGLTESDFILAAKAEQKFKPFHASA